ncbi:hypothetical protein SCHPADRAFT_900027 [Schizopora paradoxa]|uniref:60S ribosomal protein L6 n=1 Tax=Schizopora paradoxa TaxID=27342 RepID=A0A0H2SLT3_9AGAM|nr:hypothetical protein SCHPADRAFT_900027 [Schizopora paradoxa]
MARSRHLTGHVGHLTRSKTKAKRGLHKGVKKSEPVSKPAPAEHTEKQIGGANNGGTRLVPVSKAARFYPAEDAHKPKVSRKRTGKTVLKKGLAPGSVLILLAGRYSGKRVVFLKQLDSGLLLVTGPFKLNGVPLRRVNQAYTIATSTKVDLGDFKVDEKINDAYFAKTKATGKQSNEEEFFEEGKPKAKEALPEHKSTDQRSVDSAVLAAVKKTENLAKYLKASFGLSKGQFPHQLAF